MKSLKLKMRVLRYKAKTAFIMAGQATSTHPATFTFTTTQHRKVFGPSAKKWVVKWYAWKTRGIACVLTT